jgi:hypothetical protein
MFNKECNNFSFLCQGDFFTFWKKLLIVKFTKLIEGKHKECFPSFNKPALMLSLVIQNENCSNYDSHQKTSVGESKIFLGSWGDVMLVCQVDTVESNLGHVTRALVVVVVVERVEVIFWNLSWHKKWTHLSQSLNSHHTFVFVRSHSKWFSFHWRSLSYLTC